MLFFFFSSRRRHTIYWRDWSQPCALPISGGQLRPPGTRLGQAVRADPPALDGCLDAGLQDQRRPHDERRLPQQRVLGGGRERRHPADRRSEEHTSELQSRQYLVCRLLLVKKN